MNEFAVCVFNDPNEVRTRVTAVKGRCLSHLTMGPKEPDALVGFKLIFLHLAKINGGKKCLGNLGEI